MLAIAPTTIFCDSVDVADLLSDHGVALRLDDKPSGFIDYTEDPRLEKSIAVGTEQLKMYCIAYNPADLARSYLVRYWTSVLAAHWLCLRRGNPVPCSLQALYDETLGLLKQVLAGILNIPGIARRNPDWPTWSTGRLDQRYRVRKWRVERPLSEQTPPQSPRTEDWPAEIIAPYEQW